ncbi:hypothetical protein yrohd0001_25540 [Yersinia rohdei ATCC 43380]|nr:hypothetical protein yrohd0001_25540 [Yersinia rohdei ATCC 43380]
MEDKGVFNCINEQWSMFDFIKKIILIFTSLKLILIES